MRSLENYETDLKLFNGEFLSLKYTNNVEKSDFHFLIVCCSPKNVNNENFSKTFFLFVFWVNDKNDRMVLMISILKPKSLSSTFGNPKLYPNLNLNPNPNPHLNNEVPDIKPRNVAVITCVTCVSDYSDLLHVKTKAHVTTRTTRTRTTRTTRLASYGSAANRGHPYYVKQALISAPVGNYRFNKLATAGDIEENPGPTPSSVISTTSATPAATTSTTSPTCATTPELSIRKEKPNL